MAAFEYWRVKIVVSFSNGKDGTHMQFKEYRTKPRSQVIVKSDDIIIVLEIEDSLKRGGIV